jgi:hypothetical protein
MKHSTFLATLTTLLLAMPTVVTGQILNGGFETGTMYTSAPDIFNAGVPIPWAATVFTPDGYDNANIDGWPLSGIPAYDNMFGGMLANSGERFVGFAATDSTFTFGEAFEQTTAPLVPRSVYTISAHLAVDDSGNDAAGNFGGPYSGRGEIDVFLDSNFIGTLTQNTASLQWEPRSFTFVAPNISAATFSFVATIDPLSGAASYLGVDDIRIDAVPEPSSALLSAIGLAAAMRVRRKRGLSQ